MKVLVTVFLVFLSVAGLCLPASAQSEKQEHPSAQDLLVKSEVETAVSMLQAIFMKH